MTEAFLDTGYIIALEVADDQRHQDAVKHWQSLSSSLPRLVTTSFVLDEVVTFLMERLGIRTALAFDKHFDQSGFQKFP
jgi:predicted nucleic acid-binding protein